MDALTILITSLCVGLTILGILGALKLAHIL